MTDLPSGAVTFLFTDIEGSTRLVKALRDRYAAVLADHQRLEANAISTVLRGFPLQSSPAALDLTLIVLLGLLVPAVNLRFRLAVATVAGVVCAGLFALATQLAFNEGWVVSFVYPLTGLVLSAVAVLVARDTVAVVDARTARIHGRAVGRRRDRGLPDRAPARPRRRRDGLPRTGRGSEAADRAQGPEPGHGREREVPPAVSPRVPAGGGTRPSQHRSDLSRRRGERAPVHRDEVRAGHACRPAAETRSGASRRTAL
jgi:hypothetical protein